MLPLALAALAAVLVFVGWRRAPGRFGMEWTESGPRYKCGRCREWHDGFPNWAFDAPDPVLQLGALERRKRAKRDEDGYLLDQQWFFGLACLEMPVHDMPDPFVWTVWVYIPYDDVERYIALYNQRPRVGGETFDARLASSIPGYPATRNLRVRVHIRPSPTRPLVELIDVEHPLAQRQREGLSRGDMESIFETLMGVPRAVRS